MPDIILYKSMYVVGLCGESLPIMRHIVIGIKKKCITQAITFFGGH